MCEFKSAIVCRDEREKGGFKLYLSPWTESHSALETIFNLHDRGENLCKVEYRPKSMEKAHLPETYKLHIDEERAPSWFTDELKAKVTTRMDRYMRTLIIEGDVDMLIGGQFMVAPGVKIQCAKAMIINVLLGSVNVVWDGATLKSVSPAAKILRDKRAKTH